MADVIYEYLKYSNNDIEEKREEMGLPQSSSKSHSLLSNEIGFEGRNEASRLIVSKSSIYALKCQKSILYAARGKSLLELWVTTFLPD